MKIRSALHAIGLIRILVSHCGFGGGANFQNQTRLICIIVANTRSQDFGAAFLKSKNIETFFGGEVRRSIFSEKE